VLPFPTLSSLSRNATRNQDEREVHRLPSQIGHNSLSFPRRLRGQKKKEKKEIGLKVNLTNKNIYMQTAQRETLLELGTALESRMDDWLNNSSSSSVSNNSIDDFDQDSSLQSPGCTSTSSDLILNELVEANSPVQGSHPVFIENHVNQHTPAQLLLLDVVLSTPATLVIRLPHTQSIQSPVCLHYSTLINGGLESIVIIEVWQRDLGISTRM
jgi:hypothetical protein